MKQTNQKYQNFWKKIIPYSKTKDWNDYKEFKNQILIKIAIWLLKRVDETKLEFPFSWRYYVGKIKEYLY